MDGTVRGERRKWLRTPPTNGWWSIFFFQGVCFGHPYILIHRLRRTSSGSVWLDPTRAPTPNTFDWSYDWKPREPEVHEF